MPLSVERCCLHSDWVQPSPMGASVPHHTGVRCGHCSSLLGGACALVARISNLCSICDLASHLVDDLEPCGSGGCRPEPAEQGDPRCQVRHSQEFGRGAVLNSASHAAANYSSSAGACAPAHGGQHPSPNTTPPACTPVRGGGGGSRTGRRPPGG